MTDQTNVAGTEGRQFALSDRDAIFALMKMVAALAEKLTGERLEVRADTETSFLWIAGTDGEVRWSRVAASRRPADREASPPKA